MQQNDTLFLECLLFSFEKLQKQKIAYWIEILFQ